MTRRTPESVRDSSSTTSERSNPIPCLRPSPVDGNPDATCHSAIALAEILQHAGNTVRTTDLTVVVSDDASGDVTYSVLERAVLSGLRLVDMLRQTIQPTCCMDLGIIH